MSSSSYQIILAYSHVMSAGRWLPYQIIQVETGDVIKHELLVNQAATAIGGIGAKRSRRTYALSRIHPQCVRGLLSHNDSDLLQQRIISV